MVNRSQAQVWTRVAQGGAIGAIALTAAAIVTNVAGDKPAPPPERIAIPAPSTSAATTGPTQPKRTDARATAARISTVSNTPKAAPPPVEVQPEELPQVPATPPPSNVKYYGIVTMGTRSLALIKLDEHQRFVKLGDNVGDEKVEEILPEHIRLGPERIIPLEGRSGESVAKIAPSAPQVTRGTGMMQPPTANLKRSVLTGKGSSGPTPPPYIDADNALRWRRMRAQLILRGDQPMSDELNELAAKMMGENQADLKGDMTPAELEAEQAFEEKFGNSEHGGKQ